MGYKIVNDDSLTDVADAIRIKGETSRTLEFPDGFISAIQNLSPSPTLQSKSVAFTPATTTQTSSVTADSGYAGLSEVDVTVNAIPSNYKDTTDATATADKILQGYTAYANGQKLTGTASGGITPTGTISITQNGTVDVTNYASADVNVSGGGGSSYTLLHTEDIAVSTSSTTATAVKTITVTGISNANVIIYVRIRDKAGARNGYFYGTDTFFENYLKGSEQTWSISGHKFIYSYNPRLGYYASGQTVGYGVYVANLTNDGTDTITVYSRYSSQYSKTIDGTYKVEIYKLEYPDGVSPFVLI